MQKTVDYPTAIATKYPEGVVVAIARDAHGKPNPISLGWFMITSAVPPMMAISVGLKRYTLEALRHSGEFTVAFPSEEMAEEVLFYGTHSGRDMDKLQKFGARVSPTRVIDCVVLDEAVANFECKVASEMQTGDHVIFVGEVVASWVNTEPRRRLYTIGRGHIMGGVRAVGKQGQQEGG